MRNVTCPSSRCTITLLQYTLSMLSMAAILFATGMSVPAYAQPIPLVEIVQRCAGTLPVQGLTIGNTVQPDLLVDKPCRVEGTDPHYFGHVNIVKGGSLIFIEPPAEPPAKGQDFWATSIIIENGGAMLAGVDDQKPYGTNGKTLTIHLYGEDPRGDDPRKDEGPGEVVRAGAGQGRIRRLRHSDRRVEQQRQDTGDDTGPRPEGLLLPVPVIFTGMKERRPSRGRRAISATKSSHSPMAARCACTV